MASTNIKGVTVKIGADTSDFIRDLKKVDKEINYSEKQAKELQKQLELRFDDKTFSKAQAKVRSDLEATEQKAKAIKEQMAQLEKTGAIDTKGYKDLQVELEKATTQSMQLEEKLKNLDKIKLEKAYKGVTNLSKGLETAAKKTAILSTAAVAAIAGIIKLGNDARETGDEIQTLADQYDMSAESIQKWQYIALQTDASSDSLLKGIIKVRDAIGTALVGETNAATKALNALGVSMTDINGSEDAFYQTIVALSQVKDSTLQAYYANEIFSERIATELIPLLNQGADGLAELGKEFEKVGYLSNEQVKSLADFDSEMNNFEKRLENAKTQLGIALIPVMETFVDLLEKYIIPAIKKVADWFDNLSPSMQKIITGGLLLFAALSPVLYILSKVIGVIPSLIKGLQSLKTHVNQTSLGFAALAGAVGLAFDLIGNWKEMSTVEKILKSLAVAALVAAAAVTVFQASLSWGIAIGAITAGIVAGIAAIKAASDQIGVDAGISTQDSLNSATGNTNYDIPNNNGNYGSYNDNSTIDNSQYNIEVNLNATGDLDYDARSLADEVIKQIIVKKQANGR